MIEEAFVQCPACGETCCLEVDTSAGAEQSYFEDCAVCCRSMEVYVRCQPGAIQAISVTSD